VLLPPLLTRALLGKCLQHRSALVRLSGTNLLVLALQRWVHLLAVLRQRGRHAPPARALHWQKFTRLLTEQFQRRLPDPQLVLAALHKALTTVQPCAAAAVSATGTSSATGGNASASAGADMDTTEEEAEESDEQRTEREAQQMLPEQLLKLTELYLRGNQAALLSLNYSFANKLLPHAPHLSEPSLLQLAHLLTNNPGFEWNNYSR
jgi:hypothetical protein